MALPKIHTEFRLPKITYVEFKRIEMDRVLINFFMRLYNNGFTSRLMRQSRRTELTVKDFVDQISDRPQQFVDFADHRHVIERWVETHLVDLVNRGKPSQAVAAPRPLHGFTYRMRNANRTRDYGTAQHLYETLDNTRNTIGRDALAQLRDFFFQGYDALTGKADPALFTDVETQAILNLMATVHDAQDPKSRNERFPPLCNSGAELMAEDIVRLLTYRQYVPRTVMVDYLKILISFHLFIYHLRLFKLLPALVQQKGANPACANCQLSDRSLADCSYQAKIFVDVVADHRGHSAYLAQNSTDTYLRRIPGFIKAHYVGRKLDEFADELVKRRKLSLPNSNYHSVTELLKLLQPSYEDELEKFFGQRCQRLQEDMNNDGETAPEIDEILGLGLPEFETYIELLVAIRGDYHRRYIMQTLDAMSLKSRPGALMAQPHSRAARRFVLDSRLLEVLLQLAVLKPGPQGYYTEEMKIDELLQYLRVRYGLFIDRLPVGEGFDEPSITDQEALRANRAAFISRLREVGFYRDLSDAYITQTVTPRYPISRQGQSAAASR